MSVAAPAAWTQAIRRRYADLDRAPDRAVAYAVRVRGIDLAAVLDALSSSRADHGQ
jgi:hypothetical protein